MQKYKVTWLSACGEAHNVEVVATNSTQAARAVWDEEEKCLIIVRSVQVD